MNSDLSFSEIKERNFKLSTRDQVGIESKARNFFKAAHNDVSGQFLSASCATIPWWIRVCSHEAERHALRVFGAAPARAHKGGAVDLHCSSRRWHAKVAAAGARGGRNRACRLFTLAARLLTHIGSSRRGPSFLQLPAAATTGSTGSAAAAPPPATDRRWSRPSSARCCMGPDERRQRGLPSCALIAALEGTVYSPLEDAVRPQAMATSRTGSRVISTWPLFRCFSRTAHRGGSVAEALCY